jgi:hypothetical protein
VPVDLILRRTFEQPKTSRQRQEEWRGWLRGHPAADERSSDPADAASETSEVRQSGIRLQEATEYDFIFTLTLTH